MASIEKRKARTATARMGEPDAGLYPFPIHATVDDKVVAHFDAGEWWGTGGAARWLHRYNLIRVPYIQAQACRHFGRDRRIENCLHGLRVVDIGCGGGVLCEPLARLGAAVVGADPAANSIAIARRHAEGSRLEIDYRAQTAEALLNDGERFDIVLAMEVVEHVSDPQAFMARCAELVAPGGLLVASTINRTLKSYAYAIVMAQYVLRLLPHDSHQWRRFVTPAEIETALRAQGMNVGDVSGVTMNLRSRALQLSTDTAVNFMLTAARPRPIRTERSF